MAGYHRADEASHTERDGPTEMWINRALMVVAYALAIELPIVMVVR